MDNCNICNKKVQSFSHHLVCFYCKGKCHLKCLPMVSVDDTIYTNRQQERWMCIKCSGTILPFNHMYDDCDFMNALSELWFSGTSLSLNELEKRVFIPFELNDDKSYHPLFHVDPDFQYFNRATDGMVKCDYNMEDIFNMKCAQRQLESTSFSMIHFNVRSISKNLDDFKTYLSLLDVTFTVIGLTETHLSTCKESLFDIPGYTSVNKFRTVRKGGGASIYVKDSITFHTRNDISIPDDIAECVFIQIDKLSLQSDKDVVLGVIYRPPNTDVDLFTEYFDIVLGKITQENKYLYLMGDYNINLLKADQDKKTGNFVDTFFSHMCIPLINKPTRVVDNKATLIDNIYMLQYCTGQH